MCLILVLSMMVGLGVSAAAAGKIALEDFTDETSIKYKEAVDVLAGVGIISGFPDGEFKPNNTVTRAESTKIITYMLIGQVA
ncbi:MAG: S-layer homology domain-containing protein, partial [Oscillospiraceae bacterium]|nr:S-layer homology domain-containing protein [Oscillospiraceae bacterium]